MSTSFPVDERGKRSAAPVGALRRFAQKREPERVPVKIEHCELCSEVIPTEHRHLLDLSSRALVCACQACLLLFNEEGAGGRKYRLVPRRYLSLTNFQMTDQQWDELMIPVNMAFIAHHPVRLSACFEMLANEIPILAGAQLSINVLPHRARCRHCDREFAIENYVVQCPICQEWSTDVVSGTELQIMDMEIETS